MVSVATGNLIKFFGPGQCVFVCCCSGLVLGYELPDFGPDYVPRNGGASGEFFSAHTSMVYGIWYTEYLVSLSYGDICGA